MDYRHAIGKKIGEEENGMPKYEKPYKKSTAFYINISDHNCFENRRKRSK